MICYLERLDANVITFILTGKSDEQQWSNDPSDPVQPIPISREEKSAMVARGPFQPRLAEFPKKVIGHGQHARKRAFNHSWYEKYSWIEYSIAKDAVFCFCCRVFAHNNSGIKGNINNAFIKTGFSTWNKASVKFSEHQVSNCHQQSLVSWTAYRSGKGIQSALDEATQAQFKQNEAQRVMNGEYFKKLVDIVLTLAKCGKPFRGHVEAETSKNRGLFLEIFSLVKRHCPELEAYASNAPKNCTYLSNRIQNDILKSIANVMFRHMERELRNIPFSIMADETSDVAHHEQMAIVFRYHTSGTQSHYPVERFVSLRRLEKTNAESIFNEINQLIEDMNLNWNRVVSVCFDGASSMAGEFTGVQARCKAKNNDIVFVHCYGHCLNLVLVDSCVSHKNNPIIFDFFGIIQLIYNFIEGSPARHAIFEKIVRKTDASLKVLKSLSTTRWACRAEAVQAVYDDLEVIIETIEEIILSTNDSRSKITAKGILNQIKSFNFIMALEIMTPILQIIVVVSRTLQMKNIDLFEAVSCVNDLCQTLTRFRNEPSIFQDMFERAATMCTKLDIDIPATKKRKPSTRIDVNPQTATEVKTKEDEVRIWTFYPLLDSFIQGLGERFDQETKSLLVSISKLIRLNDCREDDLSLISNFFKLNKSRLAAEFRLLQEKSAVDQKLPFRNVGEWLQWFSECESRLEIYANFVLALKTFSVIPVTSCSCERCFSKLQIVLSKLRSTMTQDRLYHVMLPFIEQEIASEINFDEVIEEFKRIVPFERRMTL